MRSGAAHECVPGIAAGLHDVVVGLVEPVGELVLAEVLPDVFGWIEFWGIGRLAGWSAFFSYGSREAAYRAADYYVGERVRGAAAWPSYRASPRLYSFPLFRGGSNSTTLTAVCRRASCFRLHAMVGTFLVYETIGRN